MVEEAGYENPQKEMDFPSAKLTEKLSRSNLRIDPFAKPDLHDRYLSSEEEVSPSPEDDHSSQDEALKRKNSLTFSVQTRESDKENAIIDLFAVTESKPELAIAVPIVAVGRPKLIDITNIAPMHKRKRSADSKPLHTAHRHNLARYPTPEHVDVESFPAQEADIVVTPPARRSSLLKRRESTRLLQPDTWLPDSPTDVYESEDHYFPDLDLRPTPSYKDYDPYSLDPPRLATSPHYKYGHTRVYSGSSPAISLMGWKGITRGLSLTKKINSMQPQEKKSRMIARGAASREQLPVIPAFPFEGAEGKGFTVA